ncbi:hypothetical protein ACFOLJ_23080 [Rugamonas sp. CCM 8940]|uniref:hypothetical protein n=1 Tax=Rugamonas sp. CCM 8940 TaxID=2765359 RepID=UPI0018F6486F|nr:hypothetical protein [Rugamonas sp. CCM 8940]MBJ7312465.1 hypothetical protein [Rugamonas sp. CCM 8940]
MTGLAARRLLALPLLAALLWSLSVYPAYVPALATGLAAYAALLCWRPQLWLLVVPALLPVFDLAPYTGWYFLEELDLLLLTTVVVGYWRSAPARTPPLHAPSMSAPSMHAPSVGAARPLAPTAPLLQLPGAVRLGVLLVGASVAIAAWIGVQPLPALDANSFANYLSPYNSLRVAKGFAWLLLLYPLLRRHASAANLARYFVPGMLLGLAGASLAVAWERAVFPGLLNFSSDYRPTAPFSAMHTGGAALDAYLAMAFPFVACWLLDHHARRRLVAALLLLGLGVYAGLATFSRDVYLAYGCSAAIIGLLALQRWRRHGELDAHKTGWTLALVALAALLLREVFGSSGYRGLGAALGLLAAAALLAASGRGRWPRAWLAAGALTLLLLDLACYFYLREGAPPGTDKGAYLAYALSAAVFALALPLSQRGHGGGAGDLSLATLAFPGLGLSTALVAEHWGGAAARPAILAAIALAVALVALRWRRGAALWTLNRRSIAAGLCCAMAMAIAIPLVGSYYLGSRFSTAPGDLAVRLAHWDEALQMMDQDPATQALGMGLGRYPATYLWNNKHGEQPPTFRFGEEAGRAFLQLSVSQYQGGHGEELRMLQHVALRHGQPYQLSLDVRRRDNATGMTVAVCQRWLLYPTNCAAAPLRLRPVDGKWQHYQVGLNFDPPEQRWPLRAPSQLEISIDGGNAVLDVANLSLTAADSGEQALANGAFAQGNDRWFFSSDHNHFPWHIKNFVVNLLFEMGWCGLAAMALLLLAVAVDLLKRGLAGEAAAGVYLAALAGVMAVGLFDSIVDVPRLTLLLGLIILAATLRPAHAAPRLSRRRSGSTAAPSDRIASGG